MIVVIVVAIAIWYYRQVLGESMPKQKMLVKVKVMYLLAHEHYCNN